MLDFENAILDLFQNNRITFAGAKIVLWQLLTVLYEDEERQIEQLFINILAIGEGEEILFFNKE